MVAPESKKDAPSHGWSNLLPELLELISTKITTISNLIRFRGVCRSWRSSAKSSHLRPQIPFLILPTDAITRYFLSPINGRITPINLPQARGLTLCGSSCGWLFFIHNNLDVSLLNPLTGSTIPLPSMFDLRSLVSRSRRIPFPLSDMGKIHASFTCYAFMEPYPDSPRDCVIAFTSAPRLFVYCRLGDSEWTVVVPPRISSMAYHKGKFYSMDMSGNVSVFDVGGCEPTGKFDLARKFVAVPSLKRRWCCHMLAWGDDLLIVSNPDSFHAPLNQIEIFKLDTSHNLSLRWEKLGDIGDLKMFLQQGSLWSSVGSDVSGCRGNMIYSISKSMVNNAVREHVHVFDVEKGSCEVLPYHHNLQSHREKSIWYAPKF